MCIIKRIQAGNGQKLDVTVHKTTPPGLFKTIAKLKTFYKRR